VEDEVKGPQSLVRDEIRALTAYHVSPAQGMVKLDAMENPYRLPPELAARMGERLAKVEVNRYPDPAAPHLKQRLREAMGIPGELDIVLGNGSDELLQIISTALARPGAVALALEPSFVMYRLAAIAAGLRYVGVPLAADFSLDEDALAAAIERERPALTWIAYPNNPSGNLFPREAILRAVAAAPGLVVVDEAYYAFSGGASLLGEIGRHPNLILVRTVSKLGLARLDARAGEAAHALQRELAHDGGRRPAARRARRLRAPDRGDRRRARAPRARAGCDAAGAAICLGGELHPRARARRAGRVREPARAWYIGSHIPRLASPARPLLEAHGRNPRREHANAGCTRPGPRLTSCARPKSNATPRKPR
jgi:Aminotransferase class I and II